MTAETSLVFPGSRVLAGWWKQLALFKPRAIWVGHLLLHRLEALVVAQKPTRLDTLPSFVLKALTLTSRGTLEELDDRLHLGQALLRGLLRRLESEGLVASATAGTWTVTPLGQHGLDQGTYSRAGRERRVFYFVETEQPDRVPQFINLRNHPVSIAWAEAGSWQFNVRLLEASLQQPLQWKHRRGFPEEIQEVLYYGQNAPLNSSDSQPWERVILDRPERLLSVMVLGLSADGSERLLGFGIQETAWVLRAAEPAFVVHGDWQEVLPDLARAPSLDLWRQAWRAWCQPRGLPQAEVEACSLDCHGIRLRVAAPSRFLEHLRTVRSDALKGESWLLAGTGRIRSAALLEVVEAGR